VKLLTDASRAQNISTWKFPKQTFDRPLLFEADLDDVASSPEMQCASEDSQ
jgi:hypothetical protein